MDQIDKLVERQLDSDISNLAVMEPGSEDKKKEVENIATMLKARTDAFAAKHEAIAKYVSLGLTGITFGIGLIWQTCQYNKGFKFEETGTFVSKTMQEIKRFNPFKK